MGLGFSSPQSLRPTASQLLWQFLKGSRMTGQQTRPGKQNYLTPFYCFLWQTSTSKARHQAGKV
jgi:hypothetical protein